MKIIYYFFLKHLIITIHCVNQMNAIPNNEGKRLLINFIFSGQLLLNSLTLTAGTQ